MKFLGQKPDYGLLFLQNKFKEKNCEVSINKWLKKCGCERAKGEMSEVLGEWGESLRRLYI